MPGYELLDKELFQDMATRKSVGEFEKQIAKKVGVKYCHCVNSGTAALKIGLVALGVKRGDEVITQAFTFIATVEAILELGAIPIICNIDKSLNMCPIDLEKKITKKTKCIIPVHMAGVGAKMKEIMRVAKKHKIPVLEDSCQAFGGTYFGKHLGTIGDAGAYSFDMGKAITTGEGGALVTNNKDVYQIAREYADHGHQCNPKFPRGKDTRRIFGFNYKMTALQAQLGIEQLSKLDFILSQQRKNKQKMKDEYETEFREIPDLKGDTGDTLIFFCDNKEIALKCTKGVKTKNLPDALNWHFAGSWGFKGLEKSEDLLRRAVALPVMVYENILV